MSFLRGSSLIFLTVLLFLGIIVQGVLLTIYLSLDHEEINPKISAFTLSLLEKNETFSDANYSINSSIMEEQIYKTVEEKYYLTYDCNFFDCIEKTEDPFSLVSKHAQDYWKIKFFSFLIISLLLLSGVFLLTKNKSNFFILSSILFVASSLIFLKLKFIFDLFFVFVFGVGKDFGSLSFSSFLELFSVFLTKSSVVFIFFLIIGILFLIIGIGMKLIGISSEVSEFMDKFVGRFRKKPNVQYISQNKFSEKNIKKDNLKKKDF